MLRKDRYFSYSGAGSVAALRKIAGANVPSSHLSELLEMRPASNKGHGMFAKQPIQASTRLISDAAIISITAPESLPQIFAQFGKLASDRQNLLLGLHGEDKPERDEVLAQKLADRRFPAAKIPLMVRVASVFQANAFNVQDFDSQNNPSAKRALFPTVARLNHSCMPNAHTYYNHKTQRMDVHAIRHIACDDEVVISYFNLLLSKADRQARARAWGFECVCPACDPSNPKQREHEARRSRIREIEALYLSNTTDAIPAPTMLVQLQEMLRLVREDESLAPQLPRA